MQIEAINTQQDYEDFCDFIESGKYKSILEISNAYIIIDDSKFIFDNKFKFVYQDMIVFVSGTVPKEAPAKKEPKKAKITEKVQLIPTNVVTVSGIPFNIY